MRNDGIRDSIRAQLAAEPATIETLFEAIPVLENRKHLANALYQMVHAGLIERDDEKRYRLIGGAAVKQIPIAAVTPGRRRRHVAPPVSAGATVKPGNDAGPILETLLADAQRALDQYVYSVCDKRILDHLMAARDSARGAFRAYMEEK